jgi:hypothetical protein
MGMDNIWSKVESYRGYNLYCAVEIRNNNFALNS